MKKFVCARCGLVNLDKFVSFPHCAACGAMLPQQSPSNSKWRQLLRRPVKPFYWILAVGSGLGALGWGIASIARETRASGDKPLLVYTQIPRAWTPGETLNAKFTLDSALEIPDDTFQSVSLRLGRETQRDFVVRAVKPTPTSVEMRGRGRYYFWDELPRNTSLNLALEPRAGGTLSLRATLWAAQYQQFDVRASIESAESSDSIAADDNASAPMQKAPEMRR